MKPSIYWLSTVDATESNNTNLKMQGRENRYDVISASKEQRKSRRCRL